jgi:hypothetical protein
MPFINPPELISNEERVQKRPLVAVNLDQPAGLEWLDAISKSNMILSAILAVIHPELYEAGRVTSIRLRDDAEFKRKDVNLTLSRWASAFSGVAVLSNRRTPNHRDGFSRKQWYDILVTLGTYDSCQLTLEGLGVDLDYGPGTVVGLSGMVLQHGVPDFKGERVCYAYFMRNDVHEWAKVPSNNWMNTKHYDE